jgi:hypothetical protein
VRSLWRYYDYQEQLEYRPMSDSRLNADQAELDKYGVVRVPTDVFLWGGYRYSNASDALAAAKRGMKS